MPRDGEIDYIELPRPDLRATKRFYAQAFGRIFQDYGESCAAFRDDTQKESETGGFSPDRNVSQGRPLVVLHANHLAAMESRIRSAGGEIISGHQFPGGRRFHFRDPNGNELAVWSDK